MFIITDAGRVGVVPCVMNAKFIRDVVMVRAMVVPGNAYVILIGVAYYVIKVSLILLFKYVTERI